MGSRQNIPKNWSLVKVGDISLRIHYGYTASAINKNTGTKILRITDIQGNKVNWDSVPFCEIDEYDITKFQLSPNDIVFARTGATVGKSYLITGKIPKSVFASYLIRIQLAKSVIPQYLYYFFQSADYWRQIESKSIGTGQPNVNATSLSEIVLPLPSTKEQLAITNKIEELFSELDKSIESMEKAKRQLEVYRQVLLKDAFEGKLTDEWRKNNDLLSATRELNSIKVRRQNIIKSVAKNTAKKCLPFDFEFENHNKISIWAVAKLDKLVSISARVGWKGLKKDEYTASGPLFLSVYSLNHGKTVDFSQVNHITQERYEESPEIMLRENDVLLCKDGAGIGKVGIIKHLPSPATINSSLLIVRGNEVFEPDFLYYLFLSPKLQRIVMERVSGSAIPHLFQRDIREFMLEVPPKEEQHQIVIEIEQRLTLIEHLEHNIIDTQRKIEALRLSILKKAFIGKLIKNEDSNESSTKLLSELKDEREKYIIEQKKKLKNSIPKVKIMEEDFSIEQVLQRSETPMSARDVWQRSKHKNDIEEFYRELKLLDSKVREIRNETGSLLTLIK